MIDLPSWGAALRAWLRRHPILGFVLFSHGWTFAFWALSAALAGEAGVWAGPASVAFYLGGVGVFLGGVVMSGILDGRAGLADLWRRSIDPRPIGWHWWVLVLLLTPGLTFLAAGLAKLLGLDPALEGINKLAPRFADPVPLLALLGSLLLIGPAPAALSVTRGGSGPCR